MGLFDAEQEAVRFKCKKLVFCTKFFLLHIKINCTLASFWDNGEL